MSDLIRTIRRLLGGERRHQPRQNAERQEIVNRQYRAIAAIARQHGTTPEQLMDYRNADRILGREHR